MLRLHSFTWLWSACHVTPSQTLCPLFIYLFIYQCMIHLSAYEGRKEEKKIKKDKKERGDSISCIFNDLGAQGRGRSSLVCKIDYFNFLLSAHHLLTVSPVRTWKPKCKYKSVNPPNNAYPPVALSLAVYK